MSGTIVPSYAANAYLYGSPGQQVQPAQSSSILPFLLSAPPPAPSPLVNPVSNDQAAVDALLQISSGGTANDTPYGGPGPQGARGTGNPVADYQSLMADPTGRAAARAAFGIVSNPTSLPGFVAGTMLGQVPGIYGSVPAKGPGAFGLRGGLHGLQQMATDIYNSVVGYPSKTEAFSMEGGLKGDAPPSALTAEEAAAQAAQAAATGDIGGPKGGSGEKSSPDGGWGDATSESSGGNGGEDGGAKGEAKQGGLATFEGFKGPEHFAQGGQVIELQGGGKIAVGPGSGLDDLIPTSIEGRRAAALSDGEFVFPADVVSMMGDGSSNAGARRLYDLVRQIRQNKTGTSEQAGPLPVGDLLKRVMR